MTTDGDTWDDDWDDDGWCHIVGDIWGDTFWGNRFGPRRLDTLKLQRSL
jgi:hypothetical protein